VPLTTAPTCCSVQRSGETQRGHPGVGDESCYWPRGVDRRSWLRSPAGGAGVADSTGWVARPIAASQDGRYRWRDALVRLVSGAHPGAHRQRGGDPDLVVPPGLRALHRHHHPLVSLPLRLLGASVGVWWIPVGRHGRSELTRKREGVPASPPAVDRDPPDRRVPIRFPNSRVRVESRSVEGHFVGIRTVWSAGLNGAHGRASSPRARLSGGGIRRGPAHATCRDPAAPTPPPGRPSPPPRR
jgi:hypothetical protein